MLGQIAMRNSSIKLRSV